MALVLLHPAGARESASRISQEFSQGEEPEVERRESGIQQQAQICRRNAMRNVGSRLLDNVRNQPILFLCAVLAEEPPGSESHIADEVPIPGLDARLAGALRLMQPLADTVGGCPECQDRQRRVESKRTKDKREGADGKRYDRAPSQIDVDQAYASAHLCIGSRLPLQEPLVRKFHANEGPNDGVDADQCLVTQKC